MTAVQQPDRPSAVSVANDRLLAQLAPLPAGNLVRTPNVQQNRAVLAGNYPSGSATAPADLHGLAAQLGPFRAASESVLRGIHFVDAVTLEPTAVVIFVGCTFAQPVIMQAGSRAAYNGCRFATGANVQNAGLAADAGIIGCISPTAHVNVTTIFSL